MKYAKLIAALSLIGCSHSPTRLLYPVTSPHYSAALPGVFVLGDLTHDARNICAETNPVRSFLSSFNREIQQGYIKANLFSNFVMERDVDKDKLPTQAYLLRYRVVDIFSGFTSVSGEDHASLMIELKLYDVGHATLLERDLKQGNDIDASPLYDTTKLKPALKMSFTIETISHVSRRDNGVRNVAYIQAVAVDLANQVIKKSARTIHAAVSGGDSSSKGKADPQDECMYQEDPKTCYFMLGGKYEIGKEVDRNLSTAQKFYLMACDLKSEDACRRAKLVAEKIKQNGY